MRSKTLAALLVPIVAASQAVAATTPATPRASELEREAQRLIAAYPNQLKSYSDNSIVWSDGTKMPFDDGKTKTHEEKLAQPDLEDQVSECYPTGPLAAPPAKDFEPGRVRYEPFFLKMYGATAAVVSANLAPFQWRPSSAQLKATKINDIAQRLSDVGAALAAKGPTLSPYITGTLGGIFNWRVIAGENRLSAHSFGIAIDINTRYSDYWRWSKGGAYQNRIPFAVVEAFERAKFVWCGKWYRFDTMHFEYRPEVFCNATP